MPVGWMIAIVVLWLAVIALAVVVLGVLRQVTPVLERIAESPPIRFDPMVNGPEVGEPLPHFIARDASGEVVDEQRLRGQAALLLFVSPGCGPCRALIAELDRSELDDSLASQLVVITEQGAAGDLGLPAGVRILTEAGHEVSNALSVNGTPFAVAIGPDGIVRAGRVPNTVEHLGQLAAALAH